MKSDDVRRGRTHDAEAWLHFDTGPMHRIDRLLRTVAPKDVTLTILGESGTGKEVIARRAHELSTRCAAPFVPINCSAIPETIFESELFGHEKGAFTGANSLAIGKVEAAFGGTLFLDEIGDMPLTSQAKLLRFLETRRFMRLGGTRKIDANVRLIVATLRSLEDEVRAGRFRTDLFYRIQGIAIEVPPLRSRRSDVGPLMSHFVRSLSRRHEVTPPRFERRARRMILEYDWPGNVRELRNVIETLCLLRAGKSVRVDDLPPSIRSSFPVARGTDERDAFVEVHLDDGIAAITTQLFERALALEDGSATRAARRLGVSTRTLQRHLAGRRRP